MPVVWKVGDLVCFPLSLTGRSEYGVILKITAYQYFVFWLEDKRVWPHCREDFEVMAEKP